MIIDVVKIFAPAAVAFFVGLAITPPLSAFFVRHKLWKKRSGKVALGGGDTPLFNKLHESRDSGIPRVGGIVIWVSILLTTFLFWILPSITDSLAGEKLNFLSRNQTWLPFFTLITASILGLIDDLMQVSGDGTKPAHGLSLSIRIAAVLAIGAVGGWWFFHKLAASAITIPFVGQYDFGTAIIPFFALVMVALFSGGVIDGIDGLAGGIMSTIFGAYAVIAFSQGQIDIAAFSAVIAGATLAFLWFNIPPARFYMGESGMLGLTAALSVIAFLTDAVVELLIIALPLFLASGSDIIQIASKKIRGKKVFLIAPIHHHFEALGWPSHRVTMRFWVVGVICALIGTVIALIG